MRLSATEGPAFRLGCHFRIERRTQFGYDHTHYESAGNPLIVSPEGETKLAQGGSPG